MQLVSEKSGNFILRLPQIVYIFICFCIDKELWFEKLSEPSLLLLIRGQHNHPAWSVKITVQSVKSQKIFCPGMCQPVSSLDSILLCLGQILSGNLMKVFNRC